MRLHILSIVLLGPKLRGQDVTDRLALNTSSLHTAISCPMETLTLVTDPHPFPLIRGGGLFLMGIGAGFLLGWIFPMVWVPFAIVGAAAGIVGSGLSALLPKLGPYQWPQVAALIGAIFIEMGLIYLVVKRYQNADQRTLLFSILFVVGVHFVIMGAAHGPLILILGVLTMLNAGLACGDGDRCGLQGRRAASSGVGRGFFYYPTYTFGFG